MEHRYNYFQENPNPLVNGLSTFNHPSADGTQATNNYSENMSSTSSQDQSPFHERNHTNSSAVPLMNSHLYQMNSNNEPPRSSGPPRTNVKGIYENSQSSISDVAQNNADNYPIDPDLQPHLTGLLPRQPKRLSELHPVNEYNTNKGPITANVNTNYFSSNKSYPEPKIIEYDMEETSTESSPQHTSSLYSESTTDHDSESTHPSNVFSRHTLNRNIECHVTQESKTIVSSNQDFPVPSQFADLSLNKDDDADEHQHSILHSAYNQEDDIEDIPLTDNTNQNEIDPLSVENQENLESQFNEPSFKTSRVQTFDYYAKNKDFSQTEFNYENKQGLNPIFNSNINYSSYNAVNPSNITNPSQFIKEPFFNQSNVSTQPSSLNSSISQLSQNIPLLPYDNTKPSHEKPPTLQNFNDDLQSTECSQQNKHIQSDVQNSSVQFINSNLQHSVYKNNPQDRRVINQSTSPSQTIHDQNSYQSMKSSEDNFNYLQSAQNNELIRQQSMCSSLNSSVSESLNDIQPISSQQFTTYNPSLAHSQSVGLLTSTINTQVSTAKSLSFVTEPKTQENQNTAYQPFDDQTSNLFNLSNAAKKSTTDLDNQDSTNIALSELNNKPLQSSSNSRIQNQQEATVVDHSKPYDVKLNESEQDNVKSLSPPPVDNFIQPKNVFNPMDATSESASNYQQSSINQFTSQQQSAFDDIKKPVDLASVNNQNATVQQSKPATGSSTSQYFNSINANNHSVFNQQSLNLQSHGQQNVYTQDIKPVITSFSDSNFSSKETNKFNLGEYDQIQSNDSRVESLKNTDNVTPANQFSNMTIDNQQNIPANQRFNQDQVTSASYFSKQTSHEVKENIDEFSNCSEFNEKNYHETSSKLSEASNTPQSLSNRQIDSLSYNTNQPSAPLSINNPTEPNEKPAVQLSTNQFSSQELTNKVTSNVGSSATSHFQPQIGSNQSKIDPGLPFQPTLNPYLTQSIHNQQIPTTVPPANQFPSQISSYQSSSGSIPSSQSMPNAYPALSINQQTPSMITPISSSITQFGPQKSENVPIVQPITNAYPTQPINNQQLPTTAPSVNQFPPKMFNTQQKLDSVSDHQPISNLNSTQPINTQQSSTTVPPVNQFPPQIFNTQQKSDSVSAYQPISNSTQPIYTQQSSTTVPPVNQFPPQMFNTQQKSDSVLDHQSKSNSTSTQPIYTQQLPTTVPLVDQSPPQMFSTQQKSDSVLDHQSKSNSTSTQPIYTQQLPTTVPLVDQSPPQMFSTQQKSDSVSAHQPTSNLYPTQPTNIQQSPSTIPSQMFSNQPKSVVMPPLSATSNQFSSMSYNNQSMPNTVQPVSSVTNQFPPQIFNGATKSGIISTPQPTISQYSPQSFSNQPKLNTIPPSTGNQLPPHMFGNQSKSNITPIQTTPPSMYPSQPFDNQSRSNVVPSVPSTANQLPPYNMLSNQPKSDIVSSLQPSQYQPHSLNNQPRPNMMPPVSSTTNQLPQAQFSNEPRINTGLSNKITANRYPSQSFNNQSKGNVLSPSQAASNQYSSKPTPSNQLYTQTNAALPAQNQMAPHSSMNRSSQQLMAPHPSANFTNQNSTMFSQPTTSNLLTNLPSSMPPSINQQNQRFDSQMSPNPLPSNNYYNPIQGNGNVQQSQLPPLPGQNIKSGSKGYPQQSNMGLSSQTNYPQPNANYGQQGFHNQQQVPYRPEPNASVVQQGFAKTWGYDCKDLLKSREVLQGDGVQPPEIKLPQGYANCDNCSPDIFRCTLNKFPSSKNLLDKSRLPLGILIHPYKDLSRLTVIQCDTITRCRYCRSYINPFVQFVNNARWKCNLCYKENDLPGEFQIDPYTKMLGDPSKRPEIQNATIEYIASQDYMVRPPQPALYLFLLDVSRTATLTGYLEIVCDRILNKIMANDIPGDSRTNIGFITYDSCVHFYQISNSDGGQPKQLVVSDTNDIFLPLPDGLMVNLEENKSAIKDLLTSLPINYKESYNTGCALGAALKAAFKILAPRGGRVTVFQASLPNCGPGSLQPRNDGSTHVGSSRVLHMEPATDFYKKLALECSAEQIAVDLFFISSQYVDIATISGISKYSAGCIHHFSQFNVKSPTIVTRFINCFDRYLTRKIGFEALLRLRCTRGVAIHSFHGNFFVRSSDLLMLPNVNPDNAYGMQLSIEDTLDVPVVCFQAALLYTSSNAERRIRVHTLCIPVTDNINDVFHFADQQAIIGLIAKMAVDRSTEESLLVAREAFNNAVTDSLSAFKHCGSSYNGGVGAMLSPLSLRAFPLYVLATLKHPSFRTNQPIRLDERMFSMCQMKSLPLNILIQYIYPDLYPIHNLEEQPKVNYEKLTEIPLPPVLQLSAERIESNGVYLFDDTETLIIFIGHKCSDHLIQNLFGYVNVSSMPELITTLTEVDSKPSYLLRSFISYLQKFKPYPLPIEIIKDNGPHKLRFYSRLIEDKLETSVSYYEFLQMLVQSIK